MTDDAPHRYRIRPENPAAHLFRVSCTVAQPDPVGQCFSLPTWVPGSYLIRELARNVVRVWAQSPAGAVDTIKVAKDRWQCAPCVGPLTFLWEVYAWDLSVRGAHLDATHAYFNGTSVFPRVEGQVERPCIVDIEPPAESAHGPWRVATALSRAGAEPYGFGTYQARDYEELVDHPVELGSFVLATFEACGIPHDLVITGRHDADVDRLCRDLKRLCEHHIRFFGEPPCLARYVFLITVVGEGYGGLEHRASASLLCSRDALPRPAQEAVTEDYRGLLGLCSHEYFHVWNVKRIKPAAFIPYDLSREVYTRLLWVFEGITSYYDDLALVRCGLIGADAYLELLGQTATRVWRGTGRLKQSLAEASFDAWIKFYRQDENAPNAIVSYYAKGALVALAVDLTVRRATGNQCCLDDVMRALWVRHGVSGEGLAEDGFERLAQEVTGVDLSQLFDDLVRGTADPPLADLLREVGVELTLRSAESQADKGGKPATGGEGLRPRGVLGVRLVDSGDDARLAQVFEGGAAQRAGLAPGDVIVALAGIRTRRENLEKRVDAYPPGTSLHVHAFRRDELMELDVVLMAAPEDTVALSLKEPVDAATAARRESWLKGA